MPPTCVPWRGDAAGRSTGWSSGSASRRGVEMALSDVVRQSADALGRAARELEGGLDRFRQQAERMRQGTARTQGLPVPASAGGAASGVMGTASGAFLGASLARGIVPGRVGLPGGGVPSRWGRRRGGGWYHRRQHGLAGLRGSGGAGRPCHGGLRHDAGTRSESCAAGAGRNPPGRAPDEWPAPTRWPWWWAPRAPRPPPACASCLLV